MATAVPSRAQPPRGDQGSLSLNATPVPPRGLLLLCWPPHEYAKKNAYDNKKQTTSLITITNNKATTIEAHPRHRHHQEEK